MTSFPKSLKITARGRGQRSRRSMAIRAKRRHLRSVARLLVQIIHIKSGQGPVNHRLYEWVEFRDANVCTWCGGEFQPTGDLAKTKEHLIPRYKGRRVTERSPILGAHRICNRVRNTDTAWVPHDAPPEQIPMNQRRWIRECRRNRWTHTQ